ncbi:DUF368 domain-containing protein [Fulvivirga sp. RKSG066]|uniref:DUF368 domain-containing protein n=1 Tax=Fulvivirga aurantia TaxID=2529383 RepID=UPI0012BCF4DB|nr:DUF368 domain-containing protein [Fulvivirga aurantia]MTI22244.1 DUF368 domain-containing protein [Fulvivirga aurantia]
MSGFKNSLLLYLKGVGMGGADVVPGVSGGTVAFITGIYEELLDSIKAVDIEAFKLLFSFKLKEFWEKINGSFLLPLFLGILTSVFSLASLMHYLLNNHPISVWSFFFGLIIVSSILVLRETKKWHIINVIAIIAGTAIAYFITEATPTTTPDSYWFVFLAGAIAICAMILPGISGAFILLILGKYAYITAAISDIDIAVLLVFGAGCILGLLTFARGVSWLLHRYHDIAIGVLSGFMIGSLNKVWPWKIPTAFRINSDGEQEAYLTKNVLPGEYFRQLNEDPMVFKAVLFMALGIFIVVAIEKIASYKAGPH